ncbi:hypothetical protein QTI51_13425 [Variovorax sp. J22G73]|jgi:hypothetical protein|uniref:hypothetical protein n=1 Tax=unclassified Variovorax TaxID=663243 RepID=UPI000D5E55F0|nr:MULTISPECIES: hypothetical protein [unclassified Variovorax]MDM0004861.1 hypothetical protein [Variovorax sp. J22R203]MDM0098277.1 hypothetical protein [Variovorax sp. J22G73]
MSAAVVQYVFKPNPGINVQELIALIKEAADLWRKHGADVSLWNVQVGEIGNMTFVARAESAAKMGATVDALNEDQTFVAWRAKNMKAGLATWVRSNQAYEIPI